MNDAVVIGSGPAGLSAAIALRTAGIPTTVLEREQQAGGAPRHTQHLGFGVRDLHRLMTGPQYAQRLVETALAAGVDLRLGAPAFALPKTGAVIIATGVRERPRSARLVPGDRPAGVLTTGALQQLVLRGIPIGTTAVIVGAEHVSFSAIATLRHAGARVTAMVTDQPRHQSYAALRAVLGRGVPLHTGATVARIVGHGHVEAVELDDRTMIPCDTVVFTGDWVPEYELPRHAGLRMHDVSKSPVVDSSYRTSHPGVFAIGNVIHPAESADRCAADGRRVAEGVAAWLRGSRWPEVVGLDATPPVTWAGFVDGRITARVGTTTTGRLVALDRNGREVARGRQRLLLANRALHLAAGSALPNVATVAVRQPR